MGIGYKNSFIADLREHRDEYNGKDRYNLLNRDPRNEIEGIVCGIYKRKNSGVYGFYNMLRNILNVEDSLIRIHSNNTKLILSAKCQNSFEKERLLNDYWLRKYNIVETSEFPGTHIEIEMPLKIKRRK